MQAVFSPKPKEDLDSDSVHCFNTFWQPLQKVHWQGKGPVNFPNKKNEVCNKGRLFFKETKLCTNLSVQIFMSLLVFVQKKSVLKKELVPYNLLILSTEL